MQKIVGAGVLWKFRRHRVDHTQFISLRGDLRKEIADPESTLTTLTKGPGRLQDRADTLKLGFFQLPDRVPGILTMMLLKHRLVIKTIHLRDRTFHEQEDHAGGLGGKVRSPGRA